MFYELLTTNPLFPGENELDQINLIHKIIGTPSSDILMEFQNLTKSIKIDFKPVKGSGIDDMLPSYVSNLARDLIKSLLIYKADERISTKHALRHPYFKDLRCMESPIRNSPSPNSLRSFDADRGAGDNNTQESRLPLIRNNVKKLSDMQPNPSKSSLIDKTSYHTKKAIQDNKKKYVIPHKKKYLSIL